jgi:NAD(P)-dependent dehydrogenase (short-subunit alcohol dehydrogenase family)
MLEDKNAVIYGGGGKVGGAVARAFVREVAQGLPQRSNSREPRGGDRGDRAVEQAQAVVTRSGESMNSKLVFSACCTEGIPIANESCGWAPGLEAEFHV